MPPAVNPVPAETEVTVPWHLAVAGKRAASIVPVKKPELKEPQSVVAVSVPVVTEKAEQTHINEPQAVLTQLVVSLELPAWNCPEGPVANMLTPHIKSLLIQLLVPHVHRLKVCIVVASIPVPQTHAPVKVATVTSAVVGKLICGVAPVVAANGLAAVTEVTVPAH